MSARLLAALLALLAAQGAHAQEGYESRRVEAPATTPARVPSPETSGPRPPTTYAKPPLVPGCPDAQVLTRADIEAAGLVRLPDLFRLFGGARTTTVSGFDWAAAFGSGAGFQAADWVVVVDGEPIDVDLFGQLHLEAVPVALGAIEEAAWCAGPRWVEGRLVPGGVLALSTRDFEEWLERHGTVGHAAVMIGNETGDPGPWRYTDRAVPNVDKFGTDLDAAIRHESAGGTVGYASAKWLRFYTTDPAVAPRTQRLFETGTGPARIRLGSASAGATVRALGAYHTARLGGTFLNDVGFAPQVSQELAVRRLFGQASLAGGWRDVVAGQPIVYTLRYATTDIGPRADATDSSPEAPGPTSLRWREHRAEARLQLGRRRYWTVGAGVVGRSASSGAFDARATLLRFDGSLGDAYAGALTTDTRDLGGGVTAHLALVERGHLALWGSLGAARTLPAERPTYGFWRSEGFEGVGGAAFPYAPATPQPRDDLRAKLAGRAALAARLTLTVGLDGRYVRGLYVERRAFVVDAEGVPEMGGVVGVADADGLLVHPSAALSFEAWAASARLFYDGQFTTGDAAFEDAWASVPRHRAGLRVTGRPDASFSAWASLQVVSGAAWPAYDAALPTRWLLDVAFDKTLWRERLRLNVGARNLLGVEERYHPLGATLDLRLYVRASVRLAALRSWGPGT